ncbi:MAG: Unknown protein [uncultured Sulfurovum sp.]|uniref:AAA+ ATPase domain-containing protein n=1 Tax=uncultured Sulfurovum sp. TaxID=269237 RepID=A0A6S6SQX2_9BACT|nr:MAG: Unknown protein [uncultured Sulfurovum sp.]
MKMGSNSKVINLNKLGNVQGDEEFLRDDKVSFVSKKIQDRVKELQGFKNASSAECFSALRGHDTILIDGPRGSGKTTLLLKIKKSSEEAQDAEAYVFRIIDPTLINIQNNGEKTNSDILLMLLSQVYTLVINNIDKNRYEDNSRDRFHGILKKIKQINNSIIKGYYADSDMDYNERLYSFNEGLTLDYHFHQLFDEVCKVIEKKVLVFMIDDIDMELGIAFNIIDVIRRYLSSPLVIPIVAMNSSQAYALIKKNFFKKFDQEVETPIYSIDSESDLSFLKSLPRAYMLKSFPPSRRVETDDMYAIYDYYNNSKKEKNIPSLYFTYTNTNGIQFNINSKNLLTYFVNVVYGAYRKYDDRKKLCDTFIDYLENLSMRSFISDMRNFLETIILEDKQYRICKDELKESLIKRFLDYPRAHNRKESVLVDMWGEFIENANFVNKEGYHGNIIKKTFSIDGYNSYDRYVKTYHRLWMQSYYLKRMDINPLKTEGNNVISEMSIKKSISIMGLFEFSLRSFLPMQVTKRYIMQKGENGKLTKSKLSSSQIMFLKALATNPLRDLKNDLLGLERKLSGKQKYLGGINNLRHSIEKPYELILYDYTQREHTTIKHSSMSFLKSLVFFIEYSYLLENSKKEEQEKKIKKLILDYLPIGYLAYQDNEKTVDTLAQKMLTMDNKIYAPVLEGSETSFGIISINRFSKRIVENFSYLYRGMHCDETCTQAKPCEKHDCKSEKNQPENTDTDYFNYCFSIYISTFLNAFLVEFIESLTKDIPIYKEYLYTNQKFKKVDKSEKYMPMNEIDENNLLFRNLEIVEQYFNKELMEEDEVQIKETLFSIVIFIVRALKYYYIWSQICKDAYGYQEIFIAKKRDKEDRIVGFDVFVSYLDDQALQGIRKQIKMKRDELLQDASLKDNNKKMEIALDKYFYNDIYLKELKPEDAS